MRRFPVRFVVAALVLAVVPALALWAQTKGKTVRRAQPPKLDGAGSPFFADAFKDALRGDRPANLGSPAGAVAGGPAGTSAAPTGSGSGVSGSGWGAIISPTTIEDEIKDLKNKVDGNVSTPSAFAGNGYKAARRDFSMLAMLFGIIGEYDGDVRFKKDGPAAREVFARTAANAKVGTQQVFNEAKLRKAELQDLIGGSSPFQGKDAEAKVNWTKTCDRAPLMQHLEAIFEPRLKPALADESKFKQSLDLLARDGEVIAAIGAVLAKENMEDAGDDDYKKYCQALKDAGKLIADGVKQKNYAIAAPASGMILKACDDCHGTYR